MVNYRDFLFNRYYIAKADDIDDENIDIFSNEQKIVRAMLDDGYAMDDIDEDSIREYLDKNNGLIMETLYHAGISDKPLDDIDMRKYLAELTDVLTTSDYSGDAPRFKPMFDFIERQGGISELSSKDLQNIRNFFTANDINPVTLLKKLQSIGKRRKIQEDLNRYDLGDSPDEDIASDIEILEDALNQITEHDGRVPPSLQRDLELLVREQERRTMNLPRMSEEDLQNKEKEYFDLHGSEPSVEDVVATKPWHSTEETIIPTSRYKKPKVGQNLSPKQKKLPSGDDVNALKDNAWDKYKKDGET